jgi:four helix bundle protein
MGDFRKLIAWQEADALAGDLFDAFPPGRPNVYTDLRAQILTAAGGVPDCLAEGCASSSPAEFKRYAGMAYKSAKEVESQLARARRTRAITESQFHGFSKRADRVSKLCYGLAR